MFKPNGNFDLRSQPDEQARTGNIISTEKIDIVDDVGNGWVKVKAYNLANQVSEGFAKREWLDATEMDPKIDRLRFINACVDGAHDWKTNAAYLLAVAEIESGTKNIGSSKSSAFGPFQILADTWRQYMVDPRINLAEPDRYIPTLQPIVAAKIAADGTAALAQILPGNVNPKPPELYFTHLFGVAGAQIILDSQMRQSDIRNALLKVYATDPDPAGRADKIISANKPLLAPNGPLPVEEILKKVGEKLTEALSKAVPDDVADAADGLLDREYVAMVVEGNTTYWIIDRYDEQVGGQQLVRQVEGAAPEVLASDTKLLPLKPGVVPDDITQKLNKSAEDLQIADGQPGPRPGPGADLNALLLSKAQSCNNTLVTKHVPGTKEGRLACAWAVNEIAKQALGKVIGGNLSTNDMFGALTARHKKIDQQQLVGGAIVISPTQGGNTGHVGIVGPVGANIDDTTIYSNSSSKGVFSDFYTVRKWRTQFGQILPIHYFTLNAAHF